MRTMAAQIADVQKIEALLRAKGTRFHRTGSRVIGGYTEESDWDICILATDALTFSMYELGAAIGDSFIFGGSVAHETDTESWKNVSTEDINLILVFDEKKYNRWHTAKQVTTVLELWDKPYRIAMFNRLRCGGQPKKDTDYDPISF